MLYVWAAFGSKKFMSMYSYHWKRVEKNIITSLLFVHLSSIASISKNSEEFLTTVFQYQIICSPLFHIEALEDSWSTDKQKSGDICCAERTY